MEISFPTILGEQPFHEANEKVFLLRKNEKHSIMYDDAAPIVKKWTRK